MNPRSIRMTGLIFSAMLMMGNTTSPLPNLDAIVNLGLKQNGLSTQQMTAVVPIVGYDGNGASLRMAQISGPENAVLRVKAVLEIDHDTNGPWQYTALIPVSSLANNGRDHRVDGVGITALVTK